MNLMTNRSEGSKFTATKSLDITAITKLVRGDIKAAQKEGTLLAGIKCSVRASRYSGGQSISVTITEMPEQIWTDAFVASDPNRCFEGERYTAIAQSTLRVIERLVGAYNYDNSDSQVDYFEKKFYANVSFDFSVTKADRARVAARLAAA